MKKYIIGLDTGGTYTDAVLIIDYIIHRYWGKSLTSFIASRDSHPVLGVDFSLKIPLIGIGTCRPSLPAGRGQETGHHRQFSRALRGGECHWHARTVFRSDAAK